MPFKPGQTPLATTGSSNLGVELVVKLPVSGGTLSTPPPEPAQRPPSQPSSQSSSGSARGRGGQQRAGRAHGPPSGAESAGAAAPTPSVTQSAEPARGNKPPSAPSADAENITRAKHTHGSSTPASDDGRSKRGRKNRHSRASSVARAPSAPASQAGAASTAPVASGAVSTAPARPTKGSRDENSFQKPSSDEKKPSGGNNPKDAPPAVALASSGVQNAATAPKPPATPEAGSVCPSYARMRWCTSGAECPFLHVTPSANSPSQSRPSSDRVSDSKTAVPGSNKSGPSMAASATSSSKRSSRRGGRHKKKARPAVAEPEPELAPEAPLPPRPPEKQEDRDRDGAELCRSFAFRGWCNFGPRCCHRHEVLPETPKTMSPEAICRRNLFFKCPGLMQCANFHAPKHRKDIHLHLAYPVDCSCGRPGTHVSHVEELMDQVKRSNRREAHTGEICKLFLKGNCRNGDNACRFIHADPEIWATVSDSDDDSDYIAPRTLPSQALRPSQTSQTPQTPQTSQTSQPSQPSQASQTSQASQPSQPSQPSQSNVSSTAGQQRPSIPATKRVCPDFRKGRCEYNPCKFLHLDPVGPSNAGKEDKGSCTPRQGDAPASESAPPVQTDPNVESVQQPDPCRLYKRGRCRAGKRCKWPHVNPPGTVDDGVNSPTEPDEPSETQIPHVDDSIEVDSSLLADDPLDAEYPTPPPAPSPVPSDEHSGPADGLQWWDAMSSWQPSSEDDSWHSTGTSDSAGPSTPTASWTQPLPPTPPEKAGKENFMVPPQIRGHTESRPVPPPPPRPEPTPPVQSQIPRGVRLPHGVCIDWFRGRCGWRNCKFRHSLNPDQPQRPVCMNFLNGFCRYGSNCRRLHIVDSRQSASLFNPPIRDSNRANSWLVPIGEGMRVRLGPGFVVEDIQTAFDFGSIIISNIPAMVPLTELVEALKPFPELASVYRHEGAGDPDVIRAVASFFSQKEAAAAIAALNGAKMWETVISARPLINEATTGLHKVSDAQLRLSWAAPGRVAYVGYPSPDAAHRAVVLSRVRPIRGVQIEATIYEGLPSVSASNVRFWIPSFATPEELNAYGFNDGVMIDRPNYASARSAADALRNILEGYGDLISFKLESTPFIQRRCRAWATFASATAAREAMEGMNGMKPRFLGSEPLEIEYIFSVSYVVDAERFAIIRAELDALKDRLSASPGQGTITIDQRQSITVQLQAHDQKAMYTLKRAFEDILNGEVVKANGASVWDRYFLYDQGRQYVFSVEQGNSGVKVKVDNYRKKIIVFGPPDKRRAAIEELAAIISFLRERRVQMVPLTGNPVAFIMSEGLLKLQKELGHQNVVVDLDKRVLAIRGTPEAVEAARLAILEATSKFPAQRRIEVAQCPACQNDVTHPITLKCGHLWCRTCLIDYLVTASENQIFPFKCFGEDARCGQPIPLSAARSVLTAEQFDDVARAASRAHVQSHPADFHHCPTPDCPQVYRTVPQGTILQCPSCLIQICGSCHQEHHEGVPCVITESEADRMFKEWATEHDVKNCPGCNVPIQKDEGCNHMTCIRCQTHICWVCLATFPRGRGIYDHLRRVHGGIGL